MKLRILSEADVRRCINIEEAISAQAEAFELLAAKVPVEGLRAVVPSSDPPGITIFNPSYLRGGRGFGIKVVSDFFNNDEARMPRMSAVAILFSGESGLPQTLLEAGFLTDLRTGAGTALAARHMARPESTSLVIFGAGRVARNQLLALAQVLPLEKVRVVARSPERARAFMEWARQMKTARPIDIALADDASAAVSAADVVVCATTATEPVLDGTDLRPGTFIASVGTNRVSTREVDSETVRRASLCVIDSRADCLAHAGDFQIPIAEGVIAESTVREISDLVAGRHPGRRSKQEITFYKSIGVPIQDLVTAQWIESQAIARGIGIMVDIGGDGF